MAVNDTPKKLSAAALMAEYANLAELHDALGKLVALNIITRDEQVKYTRKFMEDRPQFRDAVQEAMNAGIHR